MRGGKREQGRIEGSKSTFHSPATLSRFGKELFESSFLLSSSSNFETPGRSYISVFFPCESDPLEHFPSYFNFLHLSLTHSTAWYAAKKRAASHPLFRRKFNVFLPPTSFPIFSRLRGCFGGTKFVFALNAKVAEEDKEGVPPYLYVLDRKQQEGEEKSFSFP